MENVPNERFERNCPICGQTISYKNARCLKQSGNKACKNCAHDKVRQKTRDPKWRKAKSEQTKALWADPSSIFNSDVYRAKLAHAQELAWKDEETRSQRQASMVRSWTNLTPEAHAERVKNIVTNTHTSEAEYKRSTSLRQTHKDHPELGAAISKRTKALMLDPDYKRRCTEKLIEAAQRTGGTSKQERALGEKLLPLGFKHKVKLCGVWVDFFNPETNTIVEYFGDWWHAHPRFHARINERYGGRHPNKQRRTIAEIVEYDTLRLRRLQEDHDVIVVWESDVNTPEKLVTCLSRLEASNVDEYVNLMKG